MKDHLRLYFSEGEREIPLTTFRSLRKEKRSISADVPP